MWKSFKQSFVRNKLNVFILDRQLRSDGIQVKVFRQIKRGSSWQDSNVASLKLRLSIETMARAELRTITLKGLRQMLRPLIRFCLKRSVGLQDWVEATKIVYLEVAVEEMTKAGQKVNMSRLSTYTGVHRRDVVRIHKEGETKEDSKRFASRVIV